MDQLIAFLTRKNIIALLILSVLAVGLLVGVRLVQQQTQLKSKATVGNCKLNPDLAPGETPSGYRWEADCSGPVCTDKSQCQGNDAIDVSSGTDTKWCYGFEDGAKCMKLVGGSVATVSSGTITNIQPNPTARSGSNWNAVNISYQVNVPSKLWYRSPSCAPIPNCGGDNLGWILMKDNGGNLSGTSNWNPPAEFQQGLSTGILLTDANNVHLATEVLGFEAVPADREGGNMGVGGVDAATCGPIVFDNRITCQGPTGACTPGSIVAGQPHNTQITMKHPANSGSFPVNSWNSGYSLNYFGEDASLLGLSAQKINIRDNVTVSGDSEYTFPVNFTPDPITIAANLDFFWEMRNPQNQQFGGQCKIQISVVSPAGPGGGTGDCPTGTSVVIPDEPTVTRVWRCRTSDQTFGCRGAGIPPNDYTCAGSSESCLACATTPILNNFPFGQCGSCENNPKTQAEDPNCEDPSATRDDNDSRCTRKTKIDSQEFRDKCIDAQCQKAGKVRDCEVTWPEDGFELVPSLCVDPAKPFCETSQPRRGFCTAGPTASPSPSTPPVGTACFFLDDKPIIGRSCTDAGARVYDTHPKIEPLILTTVGRKTIFVRFVSNLGAIRDFQRVINFNPSPKLTNVICAHSLSGVGSVVTINGTAIGLQGKGKVKVGREDATIITWNETTGVITASLDKRIEGKNDVELTRDDGKTARSECTVGTTSVLFSAQSQCKPSGNFSADNVSVKIFANAPTTIETEKPDPIIDEKVKLDKDGKPSGFAPKLEKDKKYSLIVKVPGTLAKRIDFETKGGTRNLDPVTLLIGDIAPVANPDGKVNAFDKAELTRQWSLIRDVQRTGDFNQDARVNSIDYACMRQNINQSDEEFSPSTGTASGSSGVGTTAPAGVGTTTPAGIGTTTPAGVGTTSPPPAGGAPSGTLPFRVSFDPNFTTIVAQGDMGTGTIFTLDLTLTGGPGLKSVYVQFFEAGVWGPTPPQTASILLL